MVSKRILLVAVCVAVLTATAGVFAYQTLNNPSNTKTFVFESKWSSDGETRHVEMTFAIKGENLSITAKIDDTVYDHGAFLGLAFDMSHSGEIEAWEPAYQFYANNECRSGPRFDNCFKSGGETLTVGCTPQPSPYHTCTFDEYGYAFRISIPLEELNLVNDLVWMTFAGGSSGFYYQFDFGLEV